MEFYKCYSINLHRFLKANSQIYASKGFNATTNRNFWVYLKTAKVIELLELYTKINYEKENF